MFRSSRQHCFRHGEHDSDQDNYRTRVAHMRDPRYIASAGNLHRSTSASRKQLYSEMEITHDELHDFNMSQLMRSRTPTMYDGGIPPVLEKRDILISLSHLDDQREEVIEMWVTSDIPAEPFTHWMYVLSTQGSY